MALKKTFEVSKGVFLPDAYLRADEIQITGKEHMSFAVLIDKDQSEDPIDAKSYSGPFDMNGKNVYAQAYEHLKTLPEFSGASDI